ncbi:hypothetical protein [Anaerotignum sp.]
MENEAFSNWNPQGGLCSSEENREFRGIYADGTNLFIPSVNKKISEGEYRLLRFFYELSS